LPSPSATRFPPELIQALGAGALAAEPVGGGAPPDLETEHTVEKGHGRIEERRIATTAEIVPYLGWPGAAQVCRIERTRTIGGNTSREIVYAITSLPRERAGPRELLALNRRHWAIENRLHWRRDTSFAEDASRISSGNAPQALAALRNTALRLLAPFEEPVRAIRARFAENRTAAITLVTHGFL
jgi:hypothetical protein